jgi:hypothetical protein
MKELAQGRSYQFRKSAQMTCVDEGTDSDASEEGETDGEDINVQDRTILQEGSTQDDDLEDTQDTLVNSSPDLSSNNSGTHVVVPSLQAITKRPKPIIAATDPSDTVRIFTISKQDIKLGVTYQPVQKNTYTEFSEANEMFEKYTKYWRESESMKSSTETFDVDRCRRAVINLSKKPDYECVIFTLVRGFMPTQEALELFGEPAIKKKVAAKSWFIHKIVTKKIHDQGTAEKSSLHTVESVYGPWTDLNMANHDACNKMMQFTAPVKTLRMDCALWMATHENDLCPHLRAHRDEVGKEGEGFDVRLTMSETQCPWMRHEFVEVKFVVRLHDTKGPLN